MRSRLSQILSFLKKCVTWLQEKHIISSFRITYKVVWNLILIGVITLLVGVFFAGGLAAGYYASLVKNQPILSYETMKKDITNYSETSDIYFANNVYLGKLNSDLIRTNVQLNDISTYLIHALISTEDQYFYQHHGVVPKAVFRATFQELTNQSTITGGSTLTQQLVKNQILTNEVSFQRKAKEILLALRLERFFSKPEILDDYLNAVSFGRNASGQNIAGIQAAAEGIFNVQPSQLNIPQAAFIAGLPQNPFTYTPYKNLGGGLKDDVSAGIQRAHVVLGRMLDSGYINKKQYDAAMNYDYIKHFAQSKQAALQKYPYFTQEVKNRTDKILAIQFANQDGYNGQQLSDDAHEYSLLKYESQASPSLYHRSLTIQQVANLHKVDYKRINKNNNLFSQFLDNADNQLIRGGYHIYTTINKKIYDSMQKVKNNYKGYESNRTYNGVSYPEQVGAIMIKNDTGAIISFVGGRSYAQSQLNHATQTTRSNGSTMKPILDYGPAMEMGLVQPGTILPDLPFNYANGKPLHNYAGNYHGWETARVALYRSHNIPAVRTFLRTNPSTGQAASFLTKNGVTSLISSDRTSPPSAIGAIAKGISVEENTNAYATFANGGQFKDAYMIQKITDSTGKIIYQHKIKPVKVFTPQTSFLMLDMMRDVLGPRGTAGNLKSYLHYTSDWAGKTGTSEDWKDSWFVGTNPSITLGVWNGYDYPFQMNTITYHIPTEQLFAGFANAADKIDPKLAGQGQHFNMPSGIVKRTFCGISDSLLTPECKQAGLAVTDYFNVKYVPKQKDNTLVKANYVVMNNLKYQALPSTPQEFTKQGIMLKASFIKKIPGLDLNNCPDHACQTTLKNSWVNWHNFFPERDYKADSNNNGPPNAVGNVTLNGKTLTWSASSSKNVIGYRIYQAANGTTNYQEVGHVINGDKLTFNVPSSPASYYVSAVDITGKESGQSNAVTYGSYSSTPKSPTPTAPSSKDGSGNGNNSGSGSGSSSTSNSNSSGGNSSSGNGGTSASGSTPSGNSSNTGTNPKNVQPASNGNNPTSSSGASTN